MGTVDSVRQRRHFRWPKEVRDLVREYTDRLNKGDGCQRSDRLTLVARLAELSGAIASGPSLNNSGFWT
jgi:hypothetical protein